MDKKENLSWKFYCLLGTASIGLVGGLYYLYNLFSNNFEEELSENQKNKLEELSKDLQNLHEGKIPEAQTITGTTHSVKNPQKEFTLKVFRQINELSEEMFNKEHPNWISQRRMILEKNNGKNNAEYTSFCENILAEKMRIESMAAEILLGKLGMSQYDLQMMMERIPQQDFMELQQEMLKKQSESVDKIDTAKITNETVIKAFKSFIVKKAELDEETKMFAQFMNDTSEEARMNFFLKLEIHKYQIDDYLYNSYGIDFNVLLNMINTRELTKHREIEADYNNLLRELSQTFQ